MKTSNNHDTLVLKVSILNSSRHLDVYFVEAHFVLLHLYLHSFSMQPLCAAYRICNAPVCKVISDHVKKYLNFSRFWHTCVTGYWRKCHSYNNQKIHITTNFLPKKCCLTFFECPLVSMKANYFVRGKYFTLSLS